MELQKKTRLTFTGYAEKKFFIRENGISQNEIAKETLGSIVLIETANNNVDWQANGFVYSVEVL